MAGPAAAMNAQLSEAEKVRLADYIIDNSGPLEDTEQQVERIWKDLRRAEATHRF